MYEKETDFCGCRRIDGCRGCDCLYGKLPSDLLNANIEALAQDESLDPGESSTSKWLTMSRYCSGGSMEWACSCKPVSPTRCLNAPCYVDC